MIWTPDLDNIQVLTDKAGGNMGDVTDETSNARFYLDRTYTLVYAKVHFTGTGTATLSVKMDSRFGSAHDMILRTIPGVGGGTDAFIRVGDEEYRKFTFVVDGPDKDVCVLEWTNPGTVYWGAEVGLAYAT